MPELSKDAVLKTLSHIIDPKTGLDVVEAGLISGVSIRDGGDIGFLITIDADDLPVRQALQTVCEQAVGKQLEGVRKVTAVLTAEGNMEAPRSERKPAPWNFTRIPHVKKIILVASGKGGVGKSTTAVMLARAATKAGKRVGLLDADVSGASIPRMMGMKDIGKPAFMDGMMMPITKDRIKCMSMGFIIGDDAAIMRGAMISKALNQMLRGVVWGAADAPLDILFIDLPPGTGDVHLSLVQQVPVAYGGGGAIIVTTPQEVASEDAAKCGEMFNKTYVPILGIIENMSHFTDPTSGEISYIFGKGGGERLAKQFGTELLAEIPLDMSIREAMDNGDAVDVEGYEGVITKL